MDEQNIYGVKFEINIDDLKTNMKEAKTQIKQANAEFNEASSSMDNWATSVDGINAKIKQLNTILEAERSKLANQQKNYNDVIDSINNYQTSIDQLKASKQQAIQTYGRESKEVQDLEAQIAKLERQQSMAVSSADRLKISISNQQATVNRTERSIGNYEKQLGEVKQAQQQAEKSGKSLEDELKQIRSASEDASEGVKGMSDGFSIFKGAVAGTIANAVSSFVSGIGNMIEESKEFTEDMGKLETAFTTSGYSANQAKNTYRDMVGILGETDQAVEASNHLAKLTNNQEDLSKWTDIATGVYATFGDSLPIEGLTEAANETAKVGQVTGPLADALNWAGQSEDEFNKKLEACNSEQERAQLITDTLNGLYSEASQTYKELNGDLIANRQATSDFQEAQAGLGKALLPVQTAFKSMGADILNAFVGLVTGQSSMDQFVNQIGTMVQNIVSKVGELAPQLLTKGIEMITSLSEGYATGFPIMWEKILTMIQGIGDYLADNMPTFIQKGAEILSNIITGITGQIPVLIKKVPEIITTFANIINDNFPTILAKGAELLWQLITGLLSAIPTLVENIPQIIQAIVSTFMAFNWLSLGSKIITFLGNGIKSMISFISSNAKSIFDTIVNVISNLPGQLWNLATQAVGRLGSAISGGVGTVGSAIRNIANTVVNTISSLPGQMLSIGKNLVQGLWNGISDMTGWIIGKIQGFGDSVLSGIKSFFGINSPSKETYWMGEMLDIGLGNAIADGTKKVVSKAKNMAGKVLGTMKDGLSENIPINLVDNLKAKTASALNGLRMATGGNQLAMSGVGGSNVNNYTFNQYNNSPKPLNSLQIYRNTQKQLRELKKWKDGK